ncbi:hypothetical protein BJ912DRAFT_963304 [Pholiota molesta]|nr:hypothetical protein BJ912DRAFT_963304 [Pholiota molesta]
MPASSPIERNFIHCLPRYRLRDRQPDVTIAPMLLCQICSSWRMVALTSATLWSHLSFGLNIVGSLVALTALTALTTLQRIRFFTWWKQNHRLMAPSLRLEFPAEMRIKYQYPIVFPNPHTLVKFDYDLDETSFYDIQLAPLPNPILTALRNYPLTVTPSSSLPTPSTHITHPLLSTDEEVWNDHRALPELYTVLHSTPAVTTLTLGPLPLPGGRRLRRSDAPRLGEVEPVWRRAPRLEHLRLEVTDTRTGSDVEVSYARNTLTKNLFLGTNHCLALDSPACGIRELTIVDKTRTDPRSGRFRDATMASVRKYAADALNVDVSFHVTLDSENQTAAELWNELV